MRAEARRKLNTVAGFLFGGAGVLCIGIAAWMAIHPQEPEPHPVNLAPVIDKESCRQAFSQLGFFATTNGFDITAFEGGLEDPQLKLARASMAISACTGNGIALKSFCMGQACDREGITIVMGPPAASVPAKGAAVTKPQAAGAAARK